MRLRRSIDIGEYNNLLSSLCLLLCQFQPGCREKKGRKHDPFSSLLVGEVKDGEDIVSNAKVKSLRDYRLF